MKTIRFTLLFVLLLALLWPSAAYAKTPFGSLLDDKVVFGGSYTLESGESLDGSIVIFGGAVTTEVDSTVTGDVVLIGGVAEVNGTLNGNLVGIGGAVRVTDTATVNGDLVTIGATLSRDENARINGDIVNGMGFPFIFDVPPQSVNPVIPDVPGVPDVPGIPDLSRNPSLNVSFNPLLEVFWFFFSTFMWALLAVLVVMFFVTPTEKVAKAAINQPLITGGAGLLTALLTPLALIALTLTIILIPVTIVAILVLIVAWIFGWVALGLEIGRRIAKLLNMEWAPAISAGIGTFALFFVLGGFSQLIPCVGWIPQVLVGLWGLGAVVMTRFGTQDYPTEIITGAGTPPVIVDTPLPAVVIPQTEESTSPEIERDTAPAEEPEAPKANE